MNDMIRGPGLGSQKQWLHPRRQQHSKPHAYHRMATATKGARQPADGEKEWLQGTAAASRGLRAGLEHRLGDVHHEAALVLFRRPTVGFHHILHVLDDC